MGFLVDCNSRDRTYFRLVTQTSFYMMDIDMVFTTVYVYGQNVPYKV